MQKKVFYWTSHENNVFPAMYISPLFYSNEKPLEINRIFQHRRPIMF